MRAHDVDTFPYNDVAYSWAPTTSLTERRSDFAVDAVTGLITATRRLDREDIAEYRLVVRASNPGYHNLYSDVNVTIYVADKNDNAPFISFPTPGNNVVNITDAFSAGDTVTHIVAHDLDLGHNSELEYVIVEGNEKGCFNINSVLGEIFVAPDLESKTGHTSMTFNLKVMVTDKGEPRLYSTADLDVVLTSVVLVPQASQEGKQRTNLIIVLVSCSLVACVLLVVLVMFVLFMLRRRKDSNRNRHDPAANARGSSCMEATKALLTLKSSEMTLKQSDSGEQAGRGEVVAMAQEQDSMDSGVDMSTERMRVGFEQTTNGRRQQVLYTSSANQRLYDCHTPASFLQARTCHICRVFECLHKLWHLSKFDLNAS